MKDLSIDEIVYLWSVKYKYDHILHGFSFTEDEVEAKELTPDKIDHFKSTYGDLL
jgi:hypothetical protein